MKSENDIVKEITALERKLFDDECYLDEAEKSKLQTLYETLDRDLTGLEKAIIIKERKEEMEEMTGEVTDEILNTSI